MNEKFYMKRTLKLALKAEGLTSPNPLVGAVIVKNGEVIAEDFHKKPGTPHAEALAIEKAGDKARGSTLFVNLEPCCHTEKRTPPCTKAIINAGIKEVVIAMKDPNPMVSGKGIMELQKAGIIVKFGILEEEAKRLNEFYVKYITTGKPFVILKTAMTLDGKIATPQGESRWITGEKSRKLVHQLRSKVDAVMTAIGTVKTDDPLLTTRLTKGKNPMRIIIDPELDIPLNSKILHTPPETMIVTKESSKLVLDNFNIDNKMLDKISKAEKKKILLDRNIQLIEYKGEKIDLDMLMEIIGKMGVTSLLIEGGSSLNAYALEDNIVDKVMFFIAPIIIGGKESFPAVGGQRFKKLSEAYKIKNTKVRRIGEDFLITGYLDYQ